jgi:hypothetical protein
MENVPFPDSMGLAPEGAPVECPPMSVLQVYKNRQYAQHHQAGKNALLIHEGEAPRRGPATRSGKRQFQGKRAEHQGQTSAGERKVVQRTWKDVGEGNAKWCYLPWVEATVVCPAFLGLFLTVTFGFVAPLFVCATLFFCPAATFPCAIFFLLKSFTILATYTRVS